VCIYEKVKKGKKIHNWTYAVSNLQPSDFTLEHLPGGYFSLETFSGTYHIHRGEPPQKVQYGMDTCSCEAKHDTHEFLFSAETFKLLLKWGILSLVKPEYSFAQFFYSLYNPKAFQH